MSRIVIPGGSGYLGQALAARLADRGDEVVILARGRSMATSTASTTGAPGRVRTVEWDASTLGPWVDELDGADAIVHLNGKRVDSRSTRRNVDELISSRVQPVRVVGEALARCVSPPPVWVQSGSLAIFGEGGDAVIDESTTPSGIGPREMVTDCLAWESAFRLATASVDRSVLLRMGIGFGGERDPATAKLARLVRLGLGGAIGSGRQWVSWVALDDILSAMVQAIDDPMMTGTYHVTAPEPVTNAEMMRTFRRQLRRPFGLPSPAWLTRIGAPVMGSSASLALTGRRVVPKRLLEHGFEFSASDFASVIADALDATRH